MKENNKLNSSDNFVKLPNDFIMQLSYCPPFIPYIVRTFLSVPSPLGFSTFSHPTLPYPPCVRTRTCSPAISCVYSCCIILPTEARCLKWPVRANQIYSAIVFNFLDIKWDYLNNIYISCSHFFRGQAA